MKRVFWHVLPFVTTFYILSTALTFLFLKIAGLTFSFSTVNHLLSLVGSSFIILTINILVVPSLTILLSSVVTYKFFLRVFRNYFEERFLKLTAVSCTVNGIALLSSGFTVLSLFLGGLGGGSNIFFTLLFVLFLIPVALYVFYILFTLFFQETSMPKGHKILIIIIPALIILFLNLAVEVISKPVAKFSEDQFVNNINFADNTQLEVAEIGPQRVKLGVKVPFTSNSSFTLFQLDQAFEMDIEGIVTSENHMMKPIVLSGPSYRCEVVEANTLEFQAPGQEEFISFLDIHSFDQGMKYPSGRYWLIKAYIVNDYDPNCGDDFTQQIKGRQLNIYQILKVHTSGDTDTQLIKSVMID